MSGLRGEDLRWLIDLLIRDADKWRERYEALARIEAARLETVKQDSVRSTKPE